MEGHKLDLTLIGTIGRIMFEADNATSFAVKCEVILNFFMKDPAPCRRTGIVIFVCSWLDNPGGPRAPL
jgi:hypothetical protein